MALTRKMLKAMSIEDEKIDQIIEAHTETVNALKEERDSFKEDAEKVPELLKQMDKIKDEATKDEGKNPWKVKYDALKEDFDSYKAEEKAKATKSAKIEAYKALLKEAGVAEKRIDAVAKVADIDAIELDEDGKIKESAALKKSIKEEWSDFIPTEDKKGADTPTPPANTGGTMSKEDIMNIKDTEVRQQKMLENRDLFL